MWFALAKAISNLGPFPVSRKVIVVDKNIVEYEREIRPLVDALMSKCRELDWPMIVLTGTLQSKDLVEQIVMRVNAPDQDLPRPMKELYYAITNENVLHWIIDNIEMIEHVSRDVLPENFPRGKIDITTDELKKTVDSVNEPISAEDTLFTRIAKLVVAVRRKHSDG